MPPKSARNRSASRSRSKSQARARKKVVSPPPASPTHPAAPAAVQPGQDPQPVKRRNMLDASTGLRSSSLLNLPSGDGTSVAADTRTQDKLAASPTYGKTFWQPHNKDPEQPLYAIDQVPYYLRDNPHVLRYYRAYYTTKQCVRSLFRLHNETFNVWTHLLGGLLFIGLAAYLFLAVLIPEYREGNDLVVEFTSPDKRLFHRVRARDGVQRTTWPLWIFGFYSFSCLMCMACSTYFHLCIPHLSEHVYGWAHALDYFGITFLVVGSYLPFCYYVFSCQPQYRNLYVGMICSLGLIGLLGPFFRRWTSTAFASKKILFYVCFVGAGMMPTVHIAFLPHDVGSPYVFGLLQMMFFYGIGVFIYAFRLPEIFWPGRFDRFFSSHQIWHLCVLAAALTHFFNCVRMYTDVEKIYCDAPR